MSVRARKGEFSLDGKYEQVRWLVWKMPVARQAKHGTCVRGENECFQAESGKLAAVAVHSSINGGSADFMGRTPSWNRISSRPIISCRLCLRTLGVGRLFPGTSLELRKAVQLPRMRTQCTLAYWGPYLPISGQIGLH
jgi:hypothetical protein